MLGIFHHGNISKQILEAEEQLEGESFLTEEP